MKPLCSFFIFLILALSSCGLVKDTKSGVSTTPVPNETRENTLPEPVLPIQEPKKDSPQLTQSPSSSSGMEFLIERAKEDLAQRLDVSVNQIELVEVKEVVWPDASLGCPQPGMKYKQVPEDGVLIILQAEGEVYEYHTGGGRGLFLCEKVLKDPYTPSQIDITGLTPQIRDNNNPPHGTPDNSIPPGEDQ